MVEKENENNIGGLLKSNSVVGFYFTFDDKFHPGARAYFCKVGDIHRQLRVICPLKHLGNILQSPPDEMCFPSSEITREVLTKIMRNVVCIDKNVTPNSLRLGGHTFYTGYGLNADFRDYLARRKVAKSTRLYYRASPYLTIYKLRQFFKRIFKTS